MSNDWYMDGEDNGYEQMFILNGICVDRPGSRCLAIAEPTPLAVGGLGLLLFCAFRTVLRRRHKEGGA